MNCADYKSIGIRYSEEYNVFVSRNGDIWNMNGKKLRSFKNNRGYMIVEIDGKHLRRVHRIVAKTFIPNPMHKREVNHIDGNKEHNSIDNLEWATRSENMKNYYDSDYSRCKPVLCLSDGRIIKRYHSATEAKKDGFCSQSISSCCNGKRKHHKGYSWKFA